jgi:hypothetical protein
MHRWRVVTERKRDEDAGKWALKFFAVSPDGKKFPYPSLEEAQRQCYAMLAQKAKSPR